jgi:hypothetical protein
MYFLALSHAPPLEVMAMATKRPVTMVPTRTPPRTMGPRPGSQRQDEDDDDHDRQQRGTIIFRMAALVTMSTRAP